MTELEPRPLVPGSSPAGIVDAELALDQSQEISLGGGLGGGFGSGLGSAEEVPRLEGMSIRVRLAVWVAGAALLVMVVAGYIAMDFVIESSFEESRSRASALLQTLAVTTATSLAVDEVERLDDQLTEVSRAGRDEMNIRFVACYDHEGKLVTASGRALSDPDESSFLVSEAFVDRALGSERPVWHQYRAQGGPLVLEISMPAVSGIRWGTLVASFDLTELERGIQVMRLSIVGSAFLVFAVIVLMLMRVLTLLVIEPVKQLAEAAGRVHEGDLSTRSQVLRTDELGQLAVDFNAMTAQLQSYTATLEDRVERRTQALRRANAELRRLTREDPLTGINNRRYFMERLEMEIQRSARNPHSMCLAVLDVDHFKGFNDTYGHQTGDDVLCTIARVIADKIRSTDVLARYGGEEFVLLFLDTDRSQGAIAAEKIRALIEGHRFLARDGSELPQVTVSMGLAAYPADARGAGALIAHADQALYMAKECGRNRLVLWSASARAPEPVQLELKFG